MGAPIIKWAAPTTELAYSQTLEDEVHGLCVWSRLHRHYQLMNHFQICFPDIFVMFFYSLTNVSVHFISFWHHIFIFILLLSIKNFHCCIIFVIVLINKVNTGAVAALGHGSAHLRLSAFSPAGVFVVSLYSVFWSPLSDLLSLALQTRSNRGRCYCGPFWFICFHASVSAGLPSSSAFCTSAPSWLPTLHAC